MLKELDQAYFSLIDVNRTHLIITGSIIANSNKESYTELTRKDISEMKMTHRNITQILKVCKNVNRIAANKKLKKNLYY